MQQIASIPEDVFEQHIAEAKANGPKASGGQPYQENSTDVDRSIGRNDAIHRTSLKDGPKNTGTQGQLDGRDVSGDVRVDIARNDAIPTLKDLGRPPAWNTSAPTISTHR